jgi:putative tryptophan/tyrosine transport system substrate-binding protein
MTLNRHERPNFAVMHNTAFSNYVVGCSPRRQGRPMKRREFITLLSGAAPWVSPARAQELRRVIGVLGSASYGSIGQESAFIQGLKNTGFIEGQNISIEWRYAEGQYSRLSSLAGELISRGVAVIVAFDAPAASAAKAATKTIPIVFATGADPVKIGLVDSFNRPGGNLTGVFSLISMLGPKRLELLRELLPSTSTFALLVNPSNPNVVDAPDTEAAANAIGRRLEVLTASTEGDLEAAFTTTVRRQARALIVMPDPFFFARREQLVALTARYAVPTIYPARQFIEVGGLMSYGNVQGLSEQAGTYAGKILRGANPADLPVQQSIKLELVINLKTAKALGLAIPPTLLALADQVIE